MNNIFTPKIYSPLSAFFLSFCLIITAYFVWKRKQKTLTDTLFFIFWCSTFFSFLVSFVELIWFYYFKISLFQLKIIVFIFIISLFFQAFFAFCFLFFRFFKKRIIIFLLIFFSFLPLPFLASFFWKKGEIIFQYGEPFLNVPEFWRFAYFSIFVVAILIFFCLFILFKEIKQGVISWKDFSLLYDYFSFLFYCAISIVRLSYTYPFPFLIFVFYTFIPYLSYLGFRERKT